MGWKGFRSAELAMWAIWLGALWFMAIVVAPGLFKWLPRPEAGLVAGRLFYMLSVFSVAASLVLVALSNTAGALNAGLKGNALVLLVLAVGVVELAWMHPHMAHMRDAMSNATGDELAALKASFGNMHAVSSVLYSVKMIAVLLWGLDRYGVKAAPTGNTDAA
ncbi:MAG TPA: DUF4149 domain-containing protein [Limnobacter sp.]|uniref:DUF4149 domain-containing protein n=1 Tax=Limnobacter sp. TaxID=2003368 RepID=UPI002EDA7C44